MRNIIKIETKENLYKRINDINYEKYTICIKRTKKNEASKNIHYQIVIMSL